MSDTVLVKVLKADIDRVSFKDAEEFSRGYDYALSLVLANKKVLRISKRDLFQGDFGKGFQTAMHEIPEYQFFK